MPFTYIVQHLHISTTLARLVLAYNYTVKIFITIIPIKTDDNLDIIATTGIEENWLINGMVSSLG